MDLTFRDFAWATVALVIALLSFLAGVVAEQAEMERRCVAHGAGHYVLEPLHFEWNDSKKD